jgi:hypothetical protein
VPAEIRLLDAKGGMARLKKLSEWLERDYPDAAASLLEGLDECFTINRLEIPSSLHRCLATTNLIESPHSGVEPFEHISAAKLCCSLHHAKETADHAPIQEIRLDDP